MNICDHINFYKTDLNHTSGKIKLTPPVDNYTIIVLVQTLNYSKLILRDIFLGDEASTNGSFWPCERPGLARISGLLVDGLIMLAKHFLCLFCCLSATKMPAQPCNLVSGLQSWSASILKSIFCPPHHPPTPL